MHTVYMLMFFILIIFTTSYEITTPLASLILWIIPIFEESYVDLNIPIQGQFLNKSI